MDTTITPWTDCKVAFPISDPDKVWAHVEDHPGVLPTGWTPYESDSTGFRHVFVFRVDVFPSRNDGIKVAEILKRAQE